jgi:hypothetical protein
MERDNARQFRASRKQNAVGRDSVEPHTQIIVQRLDRVSPYQAKVARLTSYIGPKRCRYSLELMNAFTISDWT